MQLVDWGFDHYQMGEIIKGLESGVDVSTYADSKCSVIQMSIIRHRLEDVSKKSQYDFYPDASTRKWIGKRYRCLNLC